jgi:hypothetical protein
MNFGWMVNHIAPAWAFFGLGVGSMLATVAGQLWYFKRHGWV